MDYRQKDDQPGSARTFVGRERELAELRTGLADVTSGRGRVGGMFLISGEPGIGKTRLADKIAGEAASRGMRVVWGRCWEGSGAPAYWPWIQVIRGCLNSAELSERHSVLESEHASSMVEAVAQIVPELHALAPRPLRPATSPRPDLPQTQFRLFDSVATLLKDFARTQPMLVLLDDLHDADYASLMMLLLVAQGLAGTGILIVGTHRDLEVRRSPELSKHIGDLSREARCIPLTGFSQEEVAQFVVLSSGQTPDDKVVARLHAATAGNPLFVDGVVRALMGDRNAEPQTAASDDFKIPDSVREAIRRRLAMLSDEAHSLLKIAAAIGNEFEAELCLRVGELSREEFNLRLDEATISGVTISLGNSRYRFAHALVRGAVYDALDTNTRIRLHGRIAETIEEIHAKDLRAHSAELAHHFGAAGATKKAIKYSNRAAKAARAVFAHADAATHWREALALSEGQRDLRRADILFSLGEVEAFYVDPPRGIAHLEEALGLYRELNQDWPVAVTCSVLGLVHIFVPDFSPENNVTRALEYYYEAQRWHGEWPSHSLGWMYRGIGVAFARQNRIDEALTSTGRAMQIWHEAANPEWVDAGSFVAQLLAIQGRHRESAVALQELMRELSRISDPHIRHTPFLDAGWIEQMVLNPLEARRFLTMVAEGSPSFFQRESGFESLVLAELQLGNLARAKELAKAHRINPSFQSALARAEGDFEGAAETQRTMLEWARRTGHLRNVANSLLGLAFCSGLTGDPKQALQDVEEAMRSFQPTDYHQQMVCRPLAASLEIEMGRPERAAEHLEICRNIIAEGEDWKGRAGLVDRAEGLLAVAQARPFANHFENAIAVFKRYSLPFEEADTLLSWGTALLDTGDRAEAHAKFDAALEIYRRCGAGQRWIDRVEGARPSMPAAQESQASAASTGPVIFGREGDFWTITQRGKTFRLRNFKGLAYIAYLLAHPGVRIHVFDLVAMVGGGAVGAPAGSVGQARADGLKARRDLGDAGEALDTKAIGEYRVRLEEVREEIAEAETNNDPGALGRARHEFDLLSNQLTAGVGRGGRVRRNSSHVERARAQVTKSIRESVVHIRRNDAKLGDHFAVSIRTGAFCAYLPNVANLADPTDLENKPS